MSFIKDSVVTENFSMDYIRFGSGRKTLVILPGLSVQSVIPAAADIEKQYDLFKKDYTVYLFDRRRELPDEYSVFDMADDTAKAIQTLGLHDCCIFGASQGGMIAAAIALKYPSLACRLVLGSTAARIDGKRAEKIGNWISLAEQKKSEELYLAFAGSVYPADIFEQYKSVFSEMSATVTDADLKRFITLAKGIYGFDILESLENIRCPVLVIGDTEDAVLGAEASLEIAGALKNRDDFELYMYDGFGHACYDTAPDYCKRLLRFFDGK